MSLQINSLNNIRTVQPSNVKLSGYLFPMNLSGASGSQTSYYMKGEDLLSAISSQIEGGGGGDPSNYVTLDGTQRITGQKTFSSINTTISGLYLSSLHFSDASHILTSTTTTSADIDNNNNSIAVTPNALKGYLNGRGYVDQDALAKAGIDDLKDAIATIGQILNDNTIWLFVDPMNPNAKTYGNLRNVNSWKFKEYTSGNINYLDIYGKASSPGLIKTIVDSVDDTLIFFQTINDAVNFSTRIKFLNNTNCYIHICNDYISPNVVNVLSSTNQILSINAKTTTFSHPDFTTSQRFIVKGCSIPTIDTDKKLNAREMYRKIILDKQGIKTIYDKFFVTYCNVTFRYLIFDGITNTNYDCYIFNNSSGMEVQFNACAFLNCDYALVGSHFNIQHTSFEDCKRCLENIGGLRTTLGGMIECVRCTDKAIRVVQGGQIVRFGSSSGYFYCSCLSGVPFEVADGGIFMINIIPDNNTIANNKTVVSCDASNKWHLVDNNDFSSTIYTASNWGDSKISSIYENWSPNLYSNSLIVHKYDNVISAYVPINFGLSNNNEYFNFDFNSLGSEVKPYMTETIAGRNTAAWTDTQKTGYFQNGFVNYAFNSNSWHQFTTNNTIFDDAYSPSAQAIRHRMSLSSKLSAINDRCINIDDPSDSSIPPMLALLSDVTWRHNGAELFNNVSGTSKYANRSYISSIDGVDISNLFLDVGDTLVSNVSSILYDKFRFTFNFN